MLLFASAALTPSCFARKPGDDRLSRDAGAVVDLRLVQPPHGATVTHRRPIVRWRSSVPSSAWSVEFCADLRCERVLQRTSADGLTAAPPDDLPTGLVFWRVSDPTRVGVASTVRWFSVPRGLRSGAPAGSGALLSPTQFDADADGHAELLDSDGNLHRTDATASVVGRIPSANLVHVISAGDVDGDGAPDIAALDPSRSALVVWRGPIVGDAAVPTWRAQLPEGGPNLSPSACALTSGDLDGDGIRDLIVSSITFQDTRGQVYIFPGSPRGPSTNNVQTLASPRGLRSAFRAFDAADLDGDGCDDLLAAAPGVSSADAGVTNIYRGTPDGLDPLPVWSNAREARDNDGLGTSGAFADVSGDGDLDLVLTAPYARMGAGCVYVFPWRPDTRTIASDPASGSCGEGAQINTLGIFVTLGDVNADGHADAVVVADGVERHTLWTARGGPDGLQEGPLIRLPEGEGPFGIARVSSTDVDLDGYADLIVENGAGGVLRLQGSPSGLRSLPQR